MGWTCGINVGEEERSREFTRNTEEKRRHRIFWSRLNENTVRSESSCRLRQRYVDMVVSIKLPLQCAAV
jgi:hypothetical protein